ncbi:MAG: rod shape-determining protein MreC [Peptococcaceae bacterium]|jgi:rod shape-determining protein MreC|nr:rod shape-determining protein MreC [Peptococcaceae bacterium]
MKRRGALWAGLFTFGVILLLYVMQRTGWQSVDMARPGKPLREIAWPVQKLADVVGGGLHQFFGYFRSNRLLREENEMLRESLETAEFWIQQMKELREENRRLGMLLEYETTQGRTFDLVIARVIGKDAENWNQMLILDQGSTSGLACDMAVIAPAGMVGRIVSVTPHTAEVLLLIDRESAIGARITETRFAPGMVSGTGQDDLLEMLRVDHDAEILPGQTVITSGYGGVFPKGLMIGTVEEVMIDTNGLTKRATIRPAVDFRRLEEVMVIRAIQETE